MVFSRAKAYEGGLSKALEQVIDKRRVYVAEDIIKYLVDAEVRFFKEGGRVYKGKHFGVAQKTVVDDVHSEYGWGDKRIRRVIKDLLRIGLIKDVGSERTVRMYHVSPNYIGSSLTKLANQFRKIKPNIKEIENGEEELD